MLNTNDHIAKIADAAKNWLRPENKSLQYAIKNTLDEGLFSIEDIKHQLLILKENIETGQIEKWAKQVGISSDHNATGKSVLCLHAGNLPLVGFQTALGTLLSGADYYGKISRKDPYLLSSFLEEVKKAELKQVVKYSKELSDFKDLNAGTVNFAGSQESVPLVKHKIRQLNAADEHARYHIRTAKFSLAFIEDMNLETLQDLVEAAFRYGGKGCRSVAIVVSKYTLDEIKSDLTDHIKSFWVKNPQHQKPKPSLQYQFAYNKAIERSQIWLEGFLIQQSDEYPETDFTLNWITGDVNKIRELERRFGQSVQSIYTDGTKIEGLETVSLSQAQRPPLWWKPDGIDVIESIVNYK